MESRRLNGLGPLSRGQLATVAAMLASIIQTVDTTIANVALPSIQGSMSATTEQAAWVLTSYIIASAIMTAPTGYLANRFGRRQLFLVSVAGFTATSVLCGLATSINELVLYRVLQGVFGAALVPMSQAILLDSYPPHKYGQAMAIWGVGIMLGPILGPTLGGYITAMLDWRWIFLINLPLGVLTFIGLKLFVDETEAQKELPFDWMGFAFIGIAIGALQLMLDRGQTLDWFSSWEIIVEAVAAALFFYLAVVHLLTADSPFFSLALFRNRNYVTGLVAIFFLGMLMLATMALLPPFLESLLGYPVELVGEIMAPRGIGTMLSMMLTGHLVARVDPRVLVAAGFSLSALALWQMSRFTAEIAPWHIVSSGLLQGFGLGFIMVPLATMAYATLQPALRNEATAVFSLLRNLGASIGLSIVVARLANCTQLHRAELVENMNSQSLDSWTGTDGAVWSTGGDRAVAMLDQVVNQQATTMAFLDNFYFIMLASLLMIPTVLLMKPGEAAVTAVKAT